MKDLNTYILGLEKGMQDKLFFVDKVNFRDYDLIIDFGCGSGELISRFAYHVPATIKIIGIDNNKMLLDVAKDRNRRNRNTYFLKSIQEIEFSKYERILTIFSSVLHEIDSSETRKIVFGLMNKSKTIVIRDMVSPGIGKIKRSIVKKFYKNVPKYMREDFERENGKVKTLEQFYHFLLKFRYVENWATEVKEDYFAGHRLVHDFYSKSGKFNVVYKELFNLEHQVIDIKSLINFNMQYPTHFKYILEKEERRSV